ncbi:uncharacterized protein Dwil_GK21332 [Drosophila willistoni]|uniref:GK21332 n=1 Tax=Drosophila willistoni TaxID=7260 RepID=B4MR38_DROWI|nr:regenerating islet-derived protein 4 [Drosophila willistoni]EDW74577.1 uncharacterized protein Dwil_GK21332 [Drosophila willistoni]
MKVLLLAVISLLAVSAEIPTTEGPSDPSPSDISYSPFSVYDSRYALGTFAKLNYFQAQITCASNGYTLASINSEADQQRIRNFFYTRGHSQLHLLNEPIWTSGTNLANLNNWVWLSTGRIFTFRNFESGSPSSSYQRCLGVNGITSLWVAEDCSAQRYFLCERRCADGFDIYN